jgi:uncharacterized protein YndB with AHSA1/START domain
MPKQKDLKRVVRARMRKTGESYTSARVHVLGKREAAARKAAGTTRKSAAAAKPPATSAKRPAKAATKTSAKKAPAKARAKEAKSDYAALAGMSDETIAAKTGCSWEKWVNHLDHFGAASKPHGEIARHVHEKFGVPGWWAQAVTVGYERIRGLRAIGQRRSGSYEVSKSKTVAAPVEQLFAAFADERARQRWMPGVAFTVRKATPSKSMRITWDDGTSVEAGFFPKGPGKSMVAVAHTKLPDKARADELKRFWGEHLDALAGQLAGAAAG